MPTFVLEKASPDGRLIGEEYTSILVHPIRSRRSLS